MSKMELPQFSDTSRASRKDLEELATAMQAKYGPLYVDPDFFESLIETHLDWSARRYQGHRWEVRTGVKDKTYYGATLHEAFCRALLELT